MSEILLASADQMRHISTGRFAAALIENAGKLFDDPAIETIDIIAAKLPR